MTRAILFAALLLTACDGGEAPPVAAAASPLAGTYRGEGRDALCIAGDGAGVRVGMIVYGEGDANCSLQGRMDPATMMLTANGDPACAFPIDDRNGALEVGASPPAACAYYCAPGASLETKRFERAPGLRVTDFAGDPLC